MSAKIMGLTVLGFLAFLTSGAALGAETVGETIVDPNLIGWWNFEEGSGAVALDSSGYGHHGTLMGDPQWVSGYDGLALDLDGQGDYIETGKVPSELGIGGDAPRTVALWAYPRSFNGGGLYEMNGHGDTEGFFLRTREFDGSWRAGYGGVDANFVTPFLNEWVHLTHTYHSDHAFVYVNGQETAYIWGESKATDGGTFRIGIGHEEAFDGLTDDVRLYDREVRPDEIARVMQGSPLLAWPLRPPDRGIETVESLESLAWSAGAMAAEHDMYFGAEAAAVREATVATEGIYRGRQSAEVTSYAVPEQPLAWDSTYYWRVDEVDAEGAIAKGRVWSFQTADYLIIDDFESYDDDQNRIYDIWFDGWYNDTGSTVGYLETICWGIPKEFIHSGMQALPFTYDNTISPWYSEASRVWEEPQDWTRFKVDTLTLYLSGFGDGSNDPNQVYAAVADEDGNLVVVNHPDPLAVGVATWQRWDIPLDDFAAAGVDVTRITQMFVGVGDRDKPTAGGEGMIHFDDFRLTRSNAAAEPNAVP